MHESALQSASQYFAMHSDACYGRHIPVIVSLAHVLQATSELTLSSDGRRPIYMLALSIQCVGSFGVATARSVPQLLLWRILQAFGASSGLSVGMGVIGDIYKVEERGTASGIFFAVSVASSMCLVEILTCLSGRYVRSCVGPPCRWRDGTLLLVENDAIRIVCVCHDVFAFDGLASTGNQPARYARHRQS